MATNAIGDDHSPPYEFVSLYTPDYSLPPPMPAAAKPRSGRGKKRRAGVNRGGGREKPNRTYITLIAEAIRAQPQQRATLAEIYDYLRRRDSFFSGEYAGWKNSVRHNLSIGDCFNKLPKSLPSGQHPSAAPMSGVKVGKGHHWVVNEGILAQGLKAHHRRGRIQLSGGGGAGLMEGPNINGAGTTPLPLPLPTPPPPPPRKKKKHRGRQTIDDAGRAVGQEEEESVRLGEEEAGRVPSLPISPSLPPATSILDYYPPVPPPPLMDFSFTAFTQSVLPSGVGGLVPLFHSESPYTKATPPTATTCYHYGEVIQKLAHTDSSWSENEAMEYGYTGNASACSNESPVSTTSNGWPNPQQYYEPTQPIDHPPPQLVCPQPQVCADPACTSALDQLRPAYYYQHSLWLPSDNNSIAAATPAMYPLAN